MEIAKPITIFLQQWDEFDATIHGPWMKKWEIVHMNQHTAELEASKDTGSSWNSP